MRRPTFDLTFLTETADYNIRHNTNNLSNNSMEDRVISLATKNDMNDDTSAFTITLASDTRWEEIVRPNDLVVINIRPNEAVDGKPNYKDTNTNDSVIVGLITEIKREGDYGDGTRLYKITGQSLAKVFMNFELRVIQNVTLSLTTGWLDEAGPDGVESLGSRLQGSTIAETFEEIIGRFVEYIKYEFKGMNGKVESLAERMQISLASWEDDEKLVDPTPYTGFEGSLNQLLKDIAVKPFTEVFFDTFKRGNYDMSEMILRRTPFDKEDWNNTQALRLYSSNVIKEELGQSDVEVYSIFNVVPENALAEDLAVFTARPQYAEKLVNKHGYKMLQVPHKFLSVTVPASESATTSGSAGSAGFPTESSATISSKFAPSRVNPVTGVNSPHNGTDYAIRMGAPVYATQPGEVVETGYRSDTGNYIWLKHSNESMYSAYYHLSSIDVSKGATVTKGQTIGKVGSTGQSTGAHLHFGVSTGLWSGYTDPEVYLANRSNETTTEEQPESNTSDDNSATDAQLQADIGKLKDYAKRLYYWYSPNAYFYYGTFTVAGHPDYRIGKRLFYYDDLSNEKWEFYIEGVQHQYSRQTGYQTVLNVTRGLKVKSFSSKDIATYASVDRFKPVYGEPKDFKGGYLGELSLEELNDLGTSEREGGGGTGGDDPNNTSESSSSDVAKRAVDFGKSFANNGRGQTAYHWGGGHGASTNPLLGSAPYKLDCSSFVWWSYAYAGVRFDGGDNTTGIKRSSNIKKKGSNLTISQLQLGDIIYFNNTSHVGMYAGGGKMVAWNGTGYNNYSKGCEISDMSSGYWYNAWDKEAWVYSK